MKASLCQCEGDVLERVAGSKRIREVAAEFDLSLPTVQTSLRRICEKLQAHSQAEAVARFLR